MADPGDTQEAKLCTMLVKAYMDADFTSEYVMGAHSWYGISIIPQQHDDGIGCSAALGIDYYTKSCGDMMISVGMTVLILPSEEDYNETIMSGAVKNSKDMIDQWKPLVLPEIAIHCNRNRVLTVGGTNE